MRSVSQVAAIVNEELASSIFALEATIVSVTGGKAKVQPTARRVFGDNDEPFEYEPISDVRLLSLVWNGGASGISGQVKAGDSCLLIAISHSDAQEPDHKTLSACAAITGFSDVAAHAFPDNVGVRVYHGNANVTLNDDNVTVESGGGAKAVLAGAAIAFDAPEGFTFNGNSKFNGDVGIVGNMTQTGGEGGGGSAKFGGDVEIEGTSTAADHKSGGVSGKDHEHPNGDDGKPTGKPTPTA